nr:unnamed protein product [Spirometra erinaceieuropaei]
MGPFGHMRIHESGLDRTPDTPTTSNTSTAHTPTLVPSVRDTTTITTASSVADTDTADFSCPHCPRTFTSRIGLVGHLRIHRTETGEPVPGAPTYSHQARLNCPHCPLTFRHRMGLFGHMRIHDDLRSHRFLQLHSMPSEELILSVDFGSTHACARLYTKALINVSEAVYHGEAPLDPEAYWKILCELTENVLRPDKKLASAVRCLGLSVQRNSFLLWDRDTSVPVTEMSRWHDTSASAFAAALNQSRFVGTINKSGRILYKALPTAKFKIISNYNLSSIFTCTRLAHIFAENPELERRCLKGEVIFGCLETWLLWRLTGGRAWCTDVSCTSTSGMFDPCTLKWSHLILNFLKVSQRILPHVCPTSCNFGIVRCGPLARDDEAKRLGVPPVRVTALIGDSQAATLGEGCLDKGDTKLTLGTGSFLNRNLGSKPIPPPKGFYPVVGWAISVKDPANNITCETSPDTKLSNVTYLLEGFNSEGGGTVSRLKRLGLFQSFDDLNDLLSAAPTPEHNQPQFRSDEVQHDVMHHTRTSSPPVFTQPRRLAAARFQAAKAELKHILQLKIIRPSESPWTSPLHIVPRVTSGDWIPCGGYSALNSTTITDQYPVPPLQHSVEPFSAKRFSRRLIWSLELTVDKLIAFEGIKASLADATLLTHPAPEAPLALMVGASAVAVGVVLRQHLTDSPRPLAFFSKKLSFVETRYSTFGRELLVIYLAVKRFRHFLEGRYFAIFTDSTFPSPDARFSHVYLDFVDALPPSSGYTHLFTCVDRHTHRAKAIPMPNVRAQTIVKAFVSRLVSIFDASSTVTTDRGAQFESAFFQTLLDFLGCKRIRTTAYNSAANGKVERFHRQLQISQRAADDLGNRSDVLPLALFGIRTVQKSNLDCSSAELVFGTTLRPSGEIVTPASRGADKIPDHFAHCLRQFMRSLSPVPLRTPTTESSIEKDLDNCTHVFVRCGNVHEPLESPYEEPFCVLTRNTKTYRISCGEKEDVPVSTGPPTPATVSSTTSAPTPTASKFTTDAQSPHAPPLSITAISIISATTSSSTTTTTTAPIPATTTPVETTATTAAPANEPNPPDGPPINFPSTSALTTNTVASPLAE